MTLLSGWFSDRCGRVRAELDRHLSVKTFQDYKMYVECFGALPVQELNEIWADVEDEEVHGGIYIIAMPPGFGKTFMLYRLRELFEKTGIGPALYQQFASDREQFSRFVSSIKAYIAEAVREWVQRIKGSLVEQASPDCVLSLLAALRASGYVRKLPLLVLLDEVSADIEKLEQLLRMLDSFALDAYVVLSLHEMKDLNMIISDLAAKGGEARYGRIRTITQFKLAVGQDDDAKGFIKKLSGGRLDEVAERVAIEILKRGLGIRHAIAFILGATRRAVDGSLLQSYEKILHDKIVAKLAAKLETASKDYCKRILKIASDPDLFLRDCTCVEVKVRKDSDKIQPQHICNRAIYVVTSPEKPLVPSPNAEVVHIRADVGQLLAGYDEVRKRVHVQEVADRLMELIAETLAERVAAQIGEAPPPPPPPVQRICDVLAKIFDGKKSMSRYELVKNPDFKQLLRELAEKRRDLLNETECVKRQRPLAACVDRFAKAVQELYGAEPLRIDGSDVYLHGPCKKQKAEQLL